MSSEESRRLHPAGIVVLALGGLRQAAVPVGAAFVALVLGGGFDAETVARTGIFAVVAAALAALGGLVSWLTTSYRVTSEAIRHRRGLLSVKETEVPLSRVQSVDTLQGPVQRLLGVVALHVQTAGGGSRGEVVLDAVAPEEARALREAVQGAAGLDPAVAAAGEDVPTGPRRSLGGRRLLVAALTAGQLGVLLPVLAAASQIADDALRGRDLDLEAGRRLVDSPAELLAAALALVALAWLLSMAGTVVAFAGFTVAREGERLRISRGFLARREATVRVGRVQAVRVVEGLLRQPFGLCALRVEVAGYKAEPAAAQTLHPLLRRTEVRSFLDELLPEMADDLGELEPPPRRARRRYVLPPAAAGAAVAALAWWLAGVGPAALLLAGLGAAAGELRYRSAGWRVRGGRLALRGRRLAQFTVLAPVPRLQEHAVSQTPLQRPVRLADLAVAVGAGTRARVRHLEAAVAWELWERLRLR